MRTPTPLPFKQKRSELCHFSEASHLAVVGHDVVIPRKPLHGSTALRAAVLARCLASLRVSLPSHRSCSHHLSFFVTVTPNFLLVAVASGISCRRNLHNPHNCDSISEWKMPTTKQREALNMRRRELRHLREDALTAQLNMVEGSSHVCCGDTTIAIMPDKHFSKCRNREGVSVFGKGAYSAKHDQSIKLNISLSHYRASCSHDAGNLALAF
ncbi:hypothetical protein KSP40_PGU015969 [Platanthera guangdongensis]|uniref:Uncharacterized protein n=1 Tax=Platanthera guangdongensis TaxID=2320717 RepID=A0ABR2MBR7_9ASPA